MFESNDVAFFDHDIMDDVCFSCFSEEFCSKVIFSEKVYFEMFEIAIKLFEHFHRLVKIAFYDIIEDIGRGIGDIFFFSLFVFSVGIPHRSRGIITECDDIVFSDEDIDLVLDIACCFRIVFRKMEDDKKIVLIGIETGILVFFGDGFPIKLVKSIIRKNLLYFVERRIDAVEPDI